MKQEIYNELSQLGAKQLITLQQSHGYSVPSEYFAQMNQQLQQIQQLSATADIYEVEPNYFAEVSQKLKAIPATANKNATPIVPIQQNQPSKAKQNFVIRDWMVAASVTALLILALFGIYKPTQPTVANYFNETEQFTDAEVALLTNQSEDYFYSLFSTELGDDTQTEEVGLIDDYFNEIDPTVLTVVE